MLVNDSRPVNGAELVPLNAGIFLKLADAERQGAGGGFQLHSFSMATRDGEVVAGAEQGRFGDALAWAPSTPLHPTTTYVVKVLAGATGDTVYVDNAGLLWNYDFSFTTGTDLLPPLAYAGPLTVDVVTSEQDVYPPECRAMCGGIVTGCAADGKAASVSAVVHVPAVSGGNAGAGYRGVLDYTFDTPSGFEAHTPRTPEEPLVGVTYFEARANEATDLTVSLKPGAPCFQVVVWDAAGQSATTSVCAPEVDVATLLSEKDAEIAARGEAPPSQADGISATGEPVTNRGIDDDSRPSGGCTSTRTSTNHAFTLLGIGAIALLTRRRARSSRARS